MDIVKRLNPFKRLHVVQAAGGSLYDAEVTGRRVVVHQTQSALHPLPRSGFGRDSERKRSARAAATEKELIHLNHKIEKLLANLDENNKSEENFGNDDECVVCLSAKATMKTLPCGHCVVCRKCFVKTIQTAVTDRCLPLRCVVCRTKILKLKQQSTPSAKSRPHATIRSAHQHHQTSGSGPQGRHPDAGTSQRSRPAAVVGGPTSKGLFASLGAPHGRATATGSGTNRLPRPMHPLLIYPSEAGGERSRPGTGAGASVGWSEDSVVAQGTNVTSRGSPLTIVGSSRRRVRNCASATAAAVHVSG